MSEFEQRAKEQSGQSEAAEPGSQLPLWPSGEEKAGGSVERVHAEVGAEVPSEPVVAAKPVEPPWTLTDLGAFVLFVAFALPAAFLATAGMFVGLRELFGWETTVGEAFQQAPMVVVLQTGWEGLWVGFIYFTVTVKYRRRFWEALQWRLGAHRPRNWLAGGAALALVAQLYFFISPTGKDLPIEQLFSSPGSGYALALFGIFVAPFVEELVFRGFIYPVFERRLGLAAAVLLTALLFAAIHASQLWGGWEEIAAIFLVGVAFSYSRGKTGSLVPSYLLHLGYNISLFVLLYLSTDGFRTLE